MGDFLKTNTGTLKSTSTTAKDLASDIRTAMRAISSAIDSASSSVSSAEARKTHWTDPSYDALTQTMIPSREVVDYDYTSQKNACLNALSLMKGVLAELKLSKLDKYSVALSNSVACIESIDSLIPKSLSDAANDVASAGVLTMASSKGTDGFFVQEGAGSDGVDVLKYADFDKDGNLIGVYDLNDVNAFYTETGMTMSALIAADIANGDAALSFEEQKAIYNNVHAWIADARAVKAFGVADEKAINEIMTAAGLQTGTLESAWDSLPVDNDVNATLTTGSMAAFGILGAFGASSLVEKTTDDSNSKKDDITDKIKLKNNGNSSDDEDDYNEKDNSKTVDTDDRITKVTKTVLSKVEEISKLEIEDVDMLAKEEFFDRYSTGELLAERRLNDNKAFESLFSTEGKADLVEKFKEMGYSENEAIAAANNKDVGLAAFMLGSQNAETAQIAQDLAKEMGFGEDFDTVYDDKPDYADLFDGDAAASLMDPSTNTAVAEAKDAFNNAKDAYTESVTEANESIQAANEAKTELETIKAKIIGESGSDTSKWSDEQIKQYNEATRKYNTAVTKANEDVAESQAAKEAYNQAKVELKTKQEEYLEKIREAVREENGIPGENSNAGNQTPNNEQTNRDPVIDSMSNEANKESTTDKIISDIVNNDQINNMIDGATNGGNNNNINKDNNVNTSGSTLDAINNIFSSM